MVRYELQRLHGAPLQRGTVDAGTTLVSLLDSLQLHRDVIVKLNGRALPDDYDISRPLRSGDVVAVFDQPEGGWESSSPRYCVRLRKSSPAR